MQPIIIRIMFATQVSQTRVQAFSQYIMPVLETYWASECCTKTVGMDLKTSNSRHALMSDLGGVI